MRFVRTADGFVNLDHVAWITTRENGGGALYSANGQLLGDTVAAVTERTFDELVPAPPGHFLITQGGDDIGEWNVETLIIAFAIGEGVTPYTLNGCEITSYPWAIKCPDGMVVQPGGKTYASVQRFRRAEAAKEK